MDLEKLSSELKEGKTAEEILTAVKEEGYELSDEDLQGVAGGHMWEPQACPQCGSTSTDWDTEIPVRGNMMTFKCNDCGFRFEIDGLEVKQQ